MRLEAGSRLARYRILDFLDAGGMGDVYRARDPRLGREVAIKVLTARFDGDERARARFEREARAVASLSHPNILSIHELGREADMLFAVTELLEGETLRRRLERGPLPARRVLQIGAAIAEGLAAAHARGVVHRDLKPENVFLVADDRVKILDFGVASLRASDDGEYGGEGEASAEAGHPGSGDGDGDEVTARVEVLAASRPGVASDTLPGEIVGTAGYLSPEQARSEPVDGRSDVFALGCVLYEMIAGRPAFVRATPVETLVALLREEPPPFPDGAPSELCAVIRQCLRKDPVKRFQTAHDLALCLRLLDPERPASAPPAPAPARTPAGAGPATIETATGRPGRATRLWTLAAALLLGALAGWLLKPVDPRPAPVLEPLTYTGRDREPAASYDGKRLAFASDRDGVSRIWLKQLAGGDETPLTEGPDRAPRFSPDDSTILFTRAEGLASSLYRVPAVGGPARKLIDGAIAGDFSPDGREVVIVRWRAAAGGEVDSVISLAAADGGGERVIATLDGRRVSQPRFAPDGRTVALAEAESPTPALVLLDPQSGASRDLRPPGAPAFLSAPTFSGRDGGLTYAITETLIPRHGGRSRVVRQRPGGDGVETLLWYSSTVRAVERLGDEALVLEFETPSMDLVETARSGDDREGGAHFFTRGSSTDRQPVYSPDGARILFSSNRSGNLDLWAVATDGGSLRRLTDDPAEDWDPAFLPDGRLLWSSRRSGAFEIWIAEADGTAPRQVTRDGVLAENPTATPDGAWIVYNSRNPNAPGVWKVRPDGSEPTLLVRGVTRLPAAAPDGEHLLYLTDIRPNGLSLRLARLDGTVLDDGVALPAAGGRARWLPAGDAIAYTVPHADGRVGIEVLPFPLPPPTARTPRPLLALGAETSVDSFALSPDGARVCYARQQVLSGLVLADGLAR